MNTWKPKKRGDLPLPEDDCAYVLGGSLHGEVMQERPLPRWLEVAVHAESWRDFSPKFVGADDKVTIAFESYRLHCVEFNGRLFKFYVYSQMRFEDALVQAFASLYTLRHDFGFKLDL